MIRRAGPRRPPALSVSGLVAGYDDAPILRGLSTAFMPGTVTGLAGPNGAGKSTLLRCLARALAPVNGSVRVAGRDLFQDLGARDAARHVALVPQEEPATDELSVRELVMLGRTPYLGAFAWPGRRDRAAVTRALALLDLVPLADRPVNALSGGERRRAIIGRALAQDARILLLDEPTVHLDLRHALELWTLLRGLAKSGRTIIVTSHDLWQLARGCDRLLLLDRGRISADGPPKRVLSSPAAARTFGLASAAVRSASTGPAGRYFG